MYSHGIGKAKDLQQAAVWYRKAADQGYAPAQYYLGVEYESGEASPGSPASDLAVPQAAAQGDVDAEYTSASSTKGKWRAAGCSTGDCVVPEAADKGFADAEYNLGVMYSHVKGSQKICRRRPCGIARPHSRAAPMRSFRLGQILSEDGSSRNLAEGRNLDSKAAEDGNADAQSQMGMMFQTGQGEAQDSKQAVVWYKKAADQGQASAQTNLGMMYITADGVSQDYEQGKRCSSRRRRRTTPTPSMTSA